MEGSFPDNCGKFLAIATIIVAALAISIAIAGFVFQNDSDATNQKKGDDFVKTAQAMGVVAIGGAMCAYICRSSS